MNAAALVARCAGAPRDLGLDQGQAFAVQVRDALARRASLADRLSAWLPGSRARRLWRDVQCYFPHHAERLLGLAAGARVSPRSLVAPLATLLEGDAALALGARVAGEGGALLARSIPEAEGWAVRQSAPENDYRSVEIAPVWSVAATIGVNEHGLAAMVTAAPPRAATLDGCAAPAALLVQDVLQRFDTVDKATEWALRRPAGGQASLVLADAAGVLGAVHVEGRVRRVVEPEGGLLFGIAAPGRLTSLEKAAAQIGNADAEGLAKGLASSGPATVAVVDPVGRRLGVAHEDGVAWHAVNATA